MSTIKTTLVGIVLAAAASHGFASTNLVTNGSFEANSVPGTFINSAQQSISNWTVGAGNVDLVGSLWTAASGVNSVDLNGSKKGEIHQTLNTVVGQTYQLSFELAGNFQGGAAIKNLSVNIGPNGLYSFDTTGKSAGSMGWTTYSTTFVAVSNATTLSFASNTSGAYGPALDNVSVSAVPEPESFAMLLAGLGMMGVIARRRKAAGTR
jgi:choice-of-anchor C domain-containing protein